MKKSAYIETFFKGFAKTLVTMAITYAFLSLLRLSAPYLEGWMNGYRYIEFLVYGCYGFMIIGIGIIYWDLGLRNYKNSAKLFAIPGDFFLIAICSGIGSSIK